MSDSPFPKVPADSTLHLWMTGWSNTEIYPSWQVATGLSAYGAGLKRNICFKLGAAGQIWPNMSILLVGQSGDGKDTIINPTETLIKACGIDPITGQTIEAIKECVFTLGTPACGVLNASELSDLLGQKDYQQGIVTSLTNLLSSGQSVDISLKSTGRRSLSQPTITVLAGSTKDWLLTMLPEGSLDGGFLPRFIIVPERSKADAKIRLQPNPNRLPKLDLLRIKRAEEQFKAHVVATAEDYIERQKVNISPDTGQPTAIEFLETDDAAAWYEEWYRRRHEMFNVSVLHAYANRSGGLIRKLAMLMAVSRKHNWIEVEDYEFAAQFIKYTGDRLEGTVVPMSREVVAAYCVLDILPATEAQILKGLGGKFGVRSVRDGMGFLVSSGQAQMKDGKFVKTKGGA